MGADTRNRHTDRRTRANPKPWGRTRGTVILTGGHARTLYPKPAVAAAAAHTCSHPVTPGRTAHPVTQPLCQMPLLTPGHTGSKALLTPAHTCSHLPTPGHTCSRSVTRSFFRTWSHSSGQTPRHAWPHPDTPVRSQPALH